MKKYILAFMVIIALTMMACQSDESEQSVAPQGLTKTSALSQLASRVSQYPTALDNVLDGTDAFAVALPVTVTVNNVTIVVDNSSSNCHDIEDIINQNTNDDDIVYFQFPIRIVYKNHQQVQVADQAQFQTILDACPPNNANTEIECIDFNYPIVINAYNTATQTPTSHTITTNAQLYNFIDGLTVNEIYSFVYPFSMTNNNGQTVTVHTDAELQAAIQAAIGSCNNSPTNEFTTILVSGTWYVSSFIEDDHDETYEFGGYNFTFTANGNVTAIKNSMTTNGTWRRIPGNGYSKFDLNFNGSQLEDLEEDWQIMEYTETLIRLKHASGGNGGIHYLTFSKN